MQYDVGDGYTWYGTENVPIEFDGDKETLAAAFLVALDEKKYHTNCGEFTFAGENFQSCDFYENGQFIEPRFLTVDEWFGVK
jgi:hypothetical protein